MYDKFILISRRTRRTLHTYKTVMTTCIHQYMHRELNTASCLNMRYIKLGSSSVSSKREAGCISSGVSGLYPNAFEVMNIHDRSFDENNLSEETLEECLQLQVWPLAEREKSDHEQTKWRRR